MQNMERRSFLGAVMAAFPLVLMGQSIKTSTPVRAARVPGGEDRFGEHHTLGVSSTDFKVSTQQRRSLHHGAHESQEGRPAASFAPQ
jgi:hypothetical protein